LEKGEHSCGLRRWQDLKFTKREVQRGARWIGMKLHQLQKIFAVHHIVQDCTWIQGLQLEFKRGIGAYTEFADVLGKIHNATLPQELPPTKLIQTYKIQKKIGRSTYFAETYTPRVFADVVARAGCSIIHLFRGQGNRYSFRSVDL